MKLFESATLKLTAWYLAILMAISIGFSLVLYQVSSYELQRGLPGVGEPRLFTITNQGAFEDFLQARVAAANARLAQNLVVVNIITLLGGGGLSYVLARRTLKPVEEAMEAQMRFTSDASHELRTPLAALRAENEVALRNTALRKSELREILQSNLEEVNKLHSLSERLLQLASEKSLPLAQTSLEEVVTEAVNRTLISAQEKRIRITTKGRPLEVLGNQESLADVVTILLDNAIKYSPAGSSISVSSSKKGKIALLKVTDEGQGIAAEDVPYIFDRFYRADNSRSNTGEETGHGLGLAIAKRIIQLHSGEITVSSTLRKGSAFTIRLSLYS